MKFKGRAYQDEIRMFAPLDRKNGDFSYFDFGENLALLQVIAGVRCTVSQRKIKELLRRYSERSILIDIFKAELSFESFQVVMDPPDSPATPIHLLGKRQTRA